MSDAPIPLPGTSIAIPPLGVGTWAWGDKATWGMGGYDSALSERTIREAWDANLDAGVTFFDTAEVYGGGESERIIGRLLAEDHAAKRAVTSIIATLADLVDELVNFMRVATLDGEVLVW